MRDTRDGDHRNRRDGIGGAPSLLGRLASSDLDDGTGGLRGVAVRGAHDAGHRDRGPAGLGRASHDQATPSDLDAAMGLERGTTETVSNRQRHPPVRHGLSGTPLALQERKYPVRR
jgi:hypothetical protein